MSFRFILFAFATCLGSLTLLARPIDDDSLHTLLKPYVKVWATADTILMERSPIPRTIVTQQQLRAKAPYQLQEVLTEVPGVFVRQYGGIGGMATMSVRGGSAAQSLVLLDGVRLNTVQTGTVDLSTIPITMVRSLDVQRGALSAVNGANALSGTMDMHLTVPPTGMRAEASGGSFDSWKGAWQGAVHLQDVALGASVEALGSAGSYAYPQVFDGDTVSINRQNGAVHTVSGILRAEGPSHSTLTLLARNTRRGVPGAVVPDVVTQTQAQFDELDVLGIGSGDVIRSGSHVVRIDAAMRYMDQRYADPQATITGAQGIDARFLARDVNVSAT